jgi:galactokinase
MIDVASLLSVPSLESFNTDGANLLRAAERLLPDGRDADLQRWFVPGRIEVFGKHTDYAGGRSLLTTSSAGIAVVSRARADRVLHVADALRDLSIELPLSTETASPTGWGNYVATVARRIARNFPEASRGADVVIASNLPRAAGMSSSSALMIGVFLAIAAANRLLRTEPLATLCSRPESLAEYVACIENGQTFQSLTGDRGVGTFGGSEDHTAILCCRSDAVTCYRFCPVVCERDVRLPPGWAFLTASSGVTASKTGAARERYNRLSLAVRAVLEEWTAASGSAAGSLGAAVRDAPRAPDDIRRTLRRSRRSDFSSDELVRRFDHFQLESEVLVPAATDAFARTDAMGLREIAVRSQAAAEELLGNQVPETVALVRRAHALGAFASSAFGAGFGGSVWALVARENLGVFSREWAGR